MVSQGLHLVVLVVARAKAQDREIDARLALGIDIVVQVALAGHPHVEVAVGCHDDAVHAALDVVALSHLVGKFEAALAVGRAVGLQATHGTHDLTPLVAGHALAHQLLAARIGHDGDAVIGAKLVDEDLERLLEQVELVRRVHGPRHVDEKHQVAALGARHILSGGGKAQHQQLGLGIPRALPHRGAHREPLARRRCRVVVVEVVDQLLDPHRTRRDLVERPAVAQHPAEVGK